ncbi:MAG: hypothetical protein ACR2JY_02455 [Chloroflexota bacterium]
MPTLPRPFIRRSADLRPATTKEEERTPLPRQRPVQSTGGRSAAVPSTANAKNTGVVATQHARAPRRTIADRLFPVRPGMTEPSWSRVIGLIIFMALVWELFSFAYTYFFGINVFGGRMAKQNTIVAWQATLQTLPWALLLSAIGSVPGFWMMRSRIRRSNTLIAQEKAAQRSAAAPRSGQGTSARARRRRAGKQGGRR